MICFLALAGSTPAAMPPRFARTVAAGFALLLVARIALLTTVWIDGQKDVAEIEQTLGPVKAGDNVLVVTVTHDDNPQYYDTMRKSRSIAGYMPVFGHLPGLFITEKSAFWPYLFTLPTQITVILQDAYIHRGGKAGEPMDYLWLEDTYKARAMAKTYPEFDDWQHNYDYVLILLAGGMHDPANFLPDKLTLIRQTDMAALYRVTKQ